MLPTIGIVEGDAFKKYLFIYLKGRALERVIAREREGEKERERARARGMAAAARPGQG